MTLVRFTLSVGGWPGAKPRGSSPSAAVALYSTRCVRFARLRPTRPTAFAELVCSNTFKSTETTNAHGLLKAEMRLLGSMVLDAADAARVPGGTALTVDRDVFSAGVTNAFRRIR